MTTVVITQPMLFPWLGFYEQLSLADVFIYLDDVSFSKGSFTNRVQINQDGATKWLTIPISSASTSRLVMDLQAADDNFKRVHEEHLEQVVKRAPFRQHAKNIMREAYEEDTIIELLIKSVELPAFHLELGLGRKLLKSSQMDVGGSSWQRVLNLVKAVGGTRYVTGHGAANYLDHLAFERSNVEVDYMRYSQATWPRGTGSLTPFLSVLDAVAWMGRGARGLVRPSTIPWRQFVGE